MNSNVVHYAKAFGRGFTNSSSNILSPVKEFSETGDPSALFESAGIVTGTGVEFILPIAEYYMKSS